VRLRRSTAREPGIARRRAGRGFSYVDQRTGRVVDPVTRERVAHLAVPPAWRDVWICADENGHLQATGVDDAGRVQYLYHAQWRVKRDQAKFDRMIEFAERLPAARRRVARHLRDPEPTRRRALACAFRILDLGCIRIGSEQYARDDGGVGLATLKSSEASVEGRVVTLAFRGKAGIHHEIDLTDARLASALEPLIARGPGTELLAYLVDGEWRDVRSADINAYIHEVVGDRFSAKDFRTWRATVTAFEALMGQDPPRTKREEARARKEAAEAAAEQLGNTPTIAKNAYIDPRVFDRYAQGRLADVDTAPEAGVLELLA
jgi:DNA topoisomerase-1